MLKVAVNFFIGLFVGAFCGIAAALLFAPKAGRELQEDIKDEYEYLRKEVESAIDESDILLEGYSGPA
jgi:gas vesicle protein